MKKENNLKKIDDDLENDKRKNKLKELEILINLLKIEDKIADGNWIKKGE